MEREGDYSDKEEITIEQLAKPIRTRVRRDKDCVIAITGYEGEGKSQLSILLARALQPGWYMASQMVWSINEQKMQALYSGMEKYQVVVADEAIKILHKQNWQSKMQKFLNKLYTLSRDENKITLLLMPRFIDFNEYFRNHRIYLWIHIIERGIAVVFRKEWNPFAKEPWNVDYNNKVITDAKQYHQYADVYAKLKIMKRCKGFLCWFRVPDLDKPTKRLYKGLKRRNKYITEEEAKQSEPENEKIMLAEIRIARLVNFIHDKLGLKKDNICSDIIQISRNTLGTYEKKMKKHDEQETFIKEKKEDDMRNILIDEEIPDDEVEETDELPIEEEQSEA